VSECVLNATEILDLGRVNAVKALAVLERPYKNKDNNTLTIVKQAIKDCVADIAEKAIYMALEIGTHPPPADIRFCHPRSGVFTACVNGRVFQVREVECLVKWSFSQNLSNFSELSCVAVDEQYRMYRVERLCKTMRGFASFRLKSGISSEIVVAFTNFWIKKYLSNFEKEIKIIWLIKLSIDGGKSVW
jgi:hypothetical protein